MTQYLLDTNIVLRIGNRSDSQYSLVKEAVDRLIARSDKCCLCAQVLIEFWVVATRPAQSNGLGWTIETTRNELDQIVKAFSVVDEAAQIFPLWLNLVTDNAVMGKRAHDARIASLMTISKIEFILTLNPRDFSGLPGITPVHPQTVIRSN